MLGNIVDEKITLRASSDIRKGEVVGYDAYGCICPVNALTKVKALRDVKKDDISQFEILRVN